MILQDGSACRTVRQRLSNRHSVQHAQVPRRIADGGSSRSPKPSPISPALYSGAVRLLLDARTTDSSSLKEDCSSSAPVAVCGFFFLLMSCAAVQFCGAAQQHKRRALPAQLAAGMAMHEAQGGAGRAVGCGRLLTLKAYPLAWLRPQVQRFNTWVLAQGAGDAGPATWRVAKGTVQQTRTAG